MEWQGDGLVSPRQEVSVLEGELVATIRELASRGVESKAIARTGGGRAQYGPAISASARTGWCADATDGATIDRCGARRGRVLYEGAAEGNAVVVHRLLGERGVDVSVRTIERAVTDIREARRAAALATVRVETAPPADFGQKRVQIGEASVRVFFLVAVLSYSRRLFVKAFLNERQADWREGAGS